MLGWMYFKTDVETQQTKCCENDTRRRRGGDLFYVQILASFILATHQAGKNLYYSFTAHEEISCLHPNPETMTTSGLQDKQYRAILERKNTYAKVIDTQAENRTNYCSWVLPHLKARTSFSTT